MTEGLISYETAELAKEKGFRLPLHSDGLYFNQMGNIHPYKWFTTLELSNYVDAPTQSLLQQWLREEHNISLELSTDWVAWTCVINKPEFVEKYVYNKKLKRNYFSSYEDALEQGLLEALKLINIEKVKSITQKIIDNTKSW